MLFHEATQPISGDILQQWQTTVTVSWSAGMSARWAKTSVPSAETKVRPGFVFFGLFVCFLGFFYSKTWRISSAVSRP